MMEPKDKNSKAFSKLPLELLESIEVLLSENFTDQVKSGKFVCDGRVYQNEMVLRCGYLKTGTISQINFDTSIETSPDKNQALEDLEELCAATKELFVDYFKNENLENFSFNWNPVFKSKTKKEIFYKYDATNTQLEAEANKLLGDEACDTPAEDLVVGDLDESENIEKIIETLQKKTLH